MELTLTRDELSRIKDSIPTRTELGEGSEVRIADDLYDYIDSGDAEVDQIGNDQIVVDFNNEQYAFLQRHNLLQNQLQTNQGTSNMKITKWDKSFVGMKFKVVSALSGHQLPVGSTVVGCQPNGATGLNVRLASAPASPAPQQHYLYFSDVVTFPQTVEEIKESIKEAVKAKEAIDNEILDLNNKIDYMTENGVEEYDDEVFKAFSVMKLLNLGTLEQAKAIVAILNKQ